MEWIDNEYSYGHEILIEVRGDISFKYANVYLESIDLLVVALHYGVKCCPEQYILHN